MTVLVVRSILLSIVLVLVLCAAWYVQVPLIVLALGVIAAVAVAWITSRKDVEEPVDIPLPPAEDQGGDRFPVLMDQIDDPLLLVDRMVVVHANPAAITLFGGHIIGEDVRLAIRHPAAADRLAGPIASEVSAVELVGLGERDRRWELNARPLDDRRRIVHLRDRTASYAAEHMRVDFVANASHELRTPLATLIGFIETLDDDAAGNQPQTRKRFLGIMAREARRMEQLVGDLMSLSRIEADKFTLPKESVDLVPLLANARSSIEAGVAVQRIEVHENGKISPVAGDPAQLSQLIYNVMGNAIKYGRPGTPVTVSIDNAPNGMVRLAVKDEGEGIAPHHLPRLTERFYRVDPGRSKKLGGTGLGLAIVKHIVERHRGRLDIRSELGVGTTVTILLPAMLS